MEVEEMSSVAELNNLSSQGLNPIGPNSLRCAICECDITCTSIKHVSLHLGGKKHMKKAKILTENSKVPLTPGWGQSAAPPPGLQQVQQQAAPTPASPASGEDPVIKPVKTDKEGRTKSIDMLYRSFVKVAEGVKTEHVREDQPPPPGEDLPPSLPPTEMTKDKGERQKPGQPNNNQRLLQHLLQAPPVKDTKKHVQ